MKLYGVQPKTLSWFAHYLTERTQKTLVNGILSDSSMVTYDLPNSNLVLKVRMYADDTRLTYASSSPGDLSHSMNPDLTSVQEWLNVNKLSLNTTKTKCMFLGTRSNLGEIAHSPAWHKHKWLPNRKSQVLQMSRRLCWGTSNMGFPHWQHLQENR